MKQIIANLLLKELKTLKLKLKLTKKQIENLIEVPPNEEFGDYSFPCFQLAKTLKKNPVDIATNLQTSLDKIKKPKQISAIQAVGPYINFFIDKKILAETIIKQILSKKQNYSKPPKTTNKKVLIEHTSINPNASPHIGRIRNSLIGDSIKRILEFQGYKTEVHYYVNDVSKQIALLTLSNKIKKFPDLLSEYIRLSKKIKNKKVENKVFQILNKLESGDKKTKASFKKIVDIAVKGQKKILENLDIKFDYFDYESDFVKQGAEIIADLKKTGKLFKDKQNRFVLNQEGYGLESKMKFPYLVLTRNDGTGLYPLRDIAYTLYKIKRIKDNIIILGEDQKLYFQQIKVALALLKKPAPKPVHYSFVLIQLKSGKNKISTREGKFVLFEDFLKQAETKAQHEMKKRKTAGDPKKIAIAAVKYAILRNEPNKNILFNLNDALSFTGDTGPYLLYSYARAKSILRKAKQKKPRAKSKIPTYEETNLIKKLANFPEIINQAFKKLAPNIIANYCFQLAQTFNEFYQKNQVLGSEEENFRLSLVKAFTIIIKQALSLLGIYVLERM